MGAGGLNGVHQVRFGWELNNLDVPFCEPPASKERLTERRREVLRQSELRLAFLANAPDVRNCRSRKAKETLMEQFLNSKKWKKIVQEINDRHGALG